MALINCPECGKQVSDKARNCIHCGYPINSNVVIIEKINGIDCDISFVIDSNLSQADKIIKMFDITGNDVAGAMKAKEIVLKYHPTPKEDPNTPHCPHCKSTNIKSISALNRGASIAMLGVFSKKINKSFECLNCKYTW